MKKILLTAGALIVALAFNPASFARTYEMQLDSVSPGSGPGGSRVRLMGRDFGASQARHRVVLVHNTHALRYMRVVSWSNNQITAVVPADAMAGASTIAILNPTGEIGPVNASRHVPFAVMASIKPGSIPGARPGSPFGSVPGAQPLPKPQLPAGSKSGPQLKPGVNVQAPRPTIPQVRPRRIAPIGCAIDPAVTHLRVIHPRKIPDGSYVFYLQATIRNIGTQAFQAGPGQAQYTLRQGTRVLHTREFRNLAPGQTISAGTNIEGWRASMEFPPDFTLAITYDPDIRIDGNPRNDDCRMTNNKKTLRGTEVLRVLTTAFP